MDSKGIHLPWAAAQGCLRKLTAELWDVYTYLRPFHAVGASASFFQEFLPGCFQACANTKPLLVRKHAASGTIPDTARFCGKSLGILGCYGIKESRETQVDSSQKRTSSGNDRVVTFTPDSTPDSREREMTSGTPLYYIFPKFPKCLSFDYDFNSCGLYTPWHGCDAPQPSVGTRASMS